MQLICNKKAEISKFSEIIYFQHVFFYSSHTQGSIITSCCNKCIKFIYIYVYVCAGDYCK